MAELPHSFPFRLVDRLGGDGVGLRLSAGGRLDATRGWPPTLALEVLAQSAASLAGPAPASGGGALAAIDAVVFHPQLAHRPLLAGETLIAELAPRGRFGRLLKVGGKVLRDGETVVEAELVLALGASAG